MDTWLILNRDAAIKRPHHTPSRRVKDSFSAMALELGKQKVITAETARVMHSRRLSPAKLAALASRAAGSYQAVRENIRR